MECLSGITKNIPYTPFKHPRGWKNNTPKNAVIMTGLDCPFLSDFCNLRVENEK